MFRNTGGGLDSAWLKITFECQVVLMIQCVRNVKRLNRVKV